MQIEDRIREFIIHNLFFTEDKSLRDEDSFVGTGVIDSMGVMELVTFVQSEFAITIDPQEIVVENFDSVQKLANVIRGKLASVSLQQSAPEARPSL